MVPPSSGTPDRGRDRVVFNKVFFAAGDPALATIAAWPVPSASWPGRWAAIFGHFGDKVGRKRCSPLRSSSRSALS
jgi:hypothetical protein